MAAPGEPGGNWSDSVSDLSPHGVLITDQHLVVRGWNSWLARHSRRPAAAVVGHGLFDLYPDLAARQFGAVYRRALEGQTQVLSHRLHRYLLPMPPADEHAAEFALMQQSAQVGPLIAGGEVVGTITVINDVTERVAREQELQQLLVQEREARAEAERAADRVERLLQVAAALSGALTPGEIAAVIVGHGGAALGAYAGLIARLDQEQTALEIVYADGYAAPQVAPWRRIPLELPSPLTEAVLTGEPVLVGDPEQFSARYPLVAAADESSSRALAAIPLAVNGRRTGVLGLSFAAPQQFSAEDRSFMAALAHQSAQALERARLFEAEHQARARAEAAVQVRNEFIWIAAHEFRTPLTALLGNAQLLERRMLKEGGYSERHQRLIHVTIDQGMRLSRMVSMMLDISRLETGRFALDTHPLDLDGLLRRLSEQIQALSTRHTVSYQGPAAPALVAGDELRLEQVFYNLLSNAIKYSPEGGPVRVRLALSGPEAVVTVQDEGIGVPAEALPQLFQQFFRAPNVDDHRISGVGIGLYIVREVVNRHGGRVSVDSGPGPGSTFTVALPRLEG